MSAVDLTGAESYSSWLWIFLSENAKFSEIVSKAMELNLSVLVLDYNFLRWGIKERPNGLQKNMVYLLFEAVPKVGLKSL